MFGLLVLADGRLTSGSDDNTIRIWDVGSGACDAVLAGHTSWIWGLALVPDGRLVSCSDDKTLRVWG